MDMLSLVFISAFGVAVVLALKYPGYGFMVGLTLFYNIGGFLSPRAFGMPSFFTLFDLGLIFAFAIGLADRVINKQTYIDNALGRLLFICLFFSLYQIVVTIWIKLNIVTPTSLLREIFIHKWRIFGIYFAIPTYYIIQKYSIEVFRIIVWVTGIVLIAYFLTLLTPLDLIRVASFKRGLGAVAERTTIYNYGYMMMTIPFALVGYLLKMRVKDKLLLLFCGFGMVITILITLTRITIITAAGMILISFFMIRKLYRLKLSALMRRASIFILIVLIILILSSGFFTSLYEVFKLTAYEVLGKVARGTTQGRTEFELVVMLPLFLDNLLTGTGYLRDYFSSYGTRYELGLADLPILGNLAIYGLIGFLIYLGRYFTVHKTTISFIRRFRPARLANGLASHDTILLLGVIINFYALILFRFHMFSIDLVYDFNAVGLGFLIGVLYGLLRKYRKSFAFETGASSNSSPPVGIGKRRIP